MDNPLENDDRVEMELDLTDEEFLQVAKMAHERDITINKMFEIILERFMEQTKENEG